MSWHVGPLRTAIHALEYKHNPTLAETLAGLMAHSWPVEIPADAALVPVPLAAERVRQRGFNQAEVLARHLSQSRQLPYPSLSKTGRSFSLTMCVPPVPR
jgi:predicted amidophosphoribosyltransferase